MDTLIRTRRHLLPLWCLLLLLPIYHSAHAHDSAARSTDLTKRKDVQGFIQHLVQTQGLQRKELESLFRKVKIQPKIIEAMNRPAEAKPWYHYRPILVDEKRIRDGAKFRAKHRDTLQRAEQRFGVPAEIVTAIIGVETRYGKYTGSYRVVDALATLGFDYPRRAKFFRKELGEFLLLANEEGIDPLSIKGSYAGAMGLAQFMPSSYREYAIDFDGDGKRDLWHNPADAIGSVANYLSRHGWRANAPIAIPAKVKRPAKVAKLLGGLDKPKYPLSRLRDHGVTPLVTVQGNPKATLIKLEEDKDRPAYWAGFKNFYVITRYNRSPKYAMAVYDLSREIDKRAGPRTARAAAVQRNEPS